MFRKPMYFAIFLLLVGLAGNAHALIVVSGSETWGGMSMNQDVQIVSGGSLTVTGQFGIVNGHTLTVEEGGQITVNARVDLDAGGTLVMNGGTASFNDEVKFPNNDDGNVYIYLYGGLLTCRDTETYADRGAELHVGGGVMRTGQVSGSRRDPESADWNIQPIPPYNDIIITDLGGDVKEISTTPVNTSVAFTSAASGDFEVFSPAVIDVNLSEAVGETVTVNYTVTDGTAIRGDDYILADGTLVFSPGQVSKPLIIGILNDGIDEEDETIVVTLSDPNGGDVILGEIIEHTYTIKDPRPVIEFAEDNPGSGAEDVTPVNLTVQISHAFGQIVTVDYAVTDGTATPNVDYNLPAGMLTFLPGQTSRDIPIDIVDDDLEEGSETIIITLSNPSSNARVGDSNEHTFTIAEYVPLLRGAFYFRADADSIARVGPHPDVMVRLGDANDKLIFRRDEGYAPVWYTQESGEQNLPVEIVRSNCENNVNTYSRVSVIETNPARAIVHWRYARDCSNIGITAWVDEYFTVYPDGVCIRTVRDSAGTSFAQWDSMVADMSPLRLLPAGIGVLPVSWLNQAQLTAVSGDYTYDGFDYQRRCYTLRCNATSDPSLLNFTLDTSGGKSINNPVIVLKNWGDADAEITVDGNDPDVCFTGYADDMYGDHLVVWLALESTNSVDITITPSGGSGLFVDRASPPAHSYDFDDSPPLPLGSSEVGPFGAYYTNLAFNDKFDQEYRVGEHADVVVQFDDNAHRLVFWRGTNYQPHWAGDTSETSENPHVSEGVGIPGLPYTCWYGTQFIERRGEDWGLPRYLEPMSDQDVRYAHVRIISSNAARAIVQWRYAPCHLDYRRNNTASDPWGDWDNEYYTIYPDGMSVRCVTAWSRDTGGADMESPHIEFHEAIPITNPGTIPEDNMHWNAVSATDYSGSSYNWIAQDVDGGAMTNLDEITNRPIMVVRMKGSTVPLTVVEGTWVEHDPVDQHDCRPFNAYDDWPAWPDGDRSFLAGSELDWLWDEDPGTHCYRYFWRQYPSHCSMFHMKWQDYEHEEDVRRVKIMLFGMVDAAEAANINNMIPLARSWEYAPNLTITSSGFTDGSYDKTERAYKISQSSADAKILHFTLDASAASPIVNPCFVIENFTGDAEGALFVDGEPVSDGPDCRRAIESNADGTSSLVIWLKMESTSEVGITLVSSFGVDDLAVFCGYWLNRCRPGEWCDGWDINHDGLMSFIDFGILASKWSGVSP